MVTEEVPLWTVREVAAFFHLHEYTVRKWIRCGAMAIVRVGPAARIRITEAEVRRLAKSEHVPLPQARRLSGTL